MENFFQFDHVFVGMRAAQFFVIVSHELWPFLINIFLGHSLDGRLVTDWGFEEW